MGTPKDKTNKKKNTGFLYFWQNWRKKNMHVRSETDHLFQGAKQHMTQYGMLKL